MFFIFFEKALDNSIPDMVQYTQKSVKEIKTMKKLLIFIACLLCLTLCIVSCGKQDSNSDASAENTETGDIDWTDIVDGTGDATGGIDAPTHTFEVGVDTSEGWGPLTPFN